MISVWPSTISSLNDSLAVLNGSVEQLKAAKLVEIAEVAEQFKTAAESAQSLRTLILSELPKASWQNREELDALLEEIQKRVEARASEQLRCRLLALASELERGRIVHRRASRVDQLNQLRDQAIKELRSQAGPEGAPQALPGPDANQWIEWVCGLQEPEDAESLQILRDGFPHLDEFLANLEPGMWIATKVPEVSGQKPVNFDPLLQEESQKSAETGALEQLRYGLLALAAKLESGRIVHHRAFRVIRLNQLRDQAIKELRSQAGLEEAPQTLPGPEADQWIEWACGLQEPEDAGSLQILRNGFPHLDEFIANLECDMWIAEGLPTPEILTQGERPADKTHLEQSRPATNGLEEALLSSGPIAIQRKAAKSPGGRDEPPVPPALCEPSLSALEADALAPDSVEKKVRPMPAPKRALPASTMSLVTDRAGHSNHSVEPPFAPKASSDTSPAPAITTDPFEALLTTVVLRQQNATKETTSDTRTRVGELWRGKWRLLLVVTAMVLVLAALGTTQWRWHRKHASNSPVNAAETKVPHLAQGNPADKGYDQPAMSTDSGTATSSKLETEKESKPKKEESAPPKPLSTVLPEKQASKPDDAALRTPEAIPHDAAVVRMEEAPPGAATGVPGSVPGGLPSGVSNSVPNLPRDVLVAKPDVPAPKVRISSGVAQGLLIHQVPPVYPSLARRAHIQGTVVLQAVIGKDGSVQSVHALSGHSLLVPAAVDAVRKWRYKPFYLNGQPTEAAIQINVNFTPSGE